jgi:DNA-binding FrmR family transcriptional regulator
MAFLAAVILFGFGLTLSSCNGCDKDKDKNTKDGSAKDTPVKDGHEDKDDNSSSADVVNGNDDAIKKAVEVARLLEKVKTAIANVQDAAKKAEEAICSKQWAEIRAAKFAEESKIWSRVGSLVMYVTVSSVKNGGGTQGVDPWALKANNWVNARVVLADKAKAVIDMTVDENGWKSAVGVASTATDKDMDEEWKNVLNSDVVWGRCRDTTRKHAKLYYRDSIFGDVDNAATEFDNARNGLNVAQAELIKAMDEWIKAKN